MEWGAIAEVIVAVYVCKLILAALDTPLIYLACHLLRRAFGLETGGAPSKAPLAD